MKSKLMKCAAILTLTAMLAGTAATAFAANNAKTAAAAADTAAASTTVTAASAAVDYQDATAINLSDSGITVDGKAVSTDASAAVYTANDIIYYEDRDTYDDGNTYGEGSSSDKHTAAEAAAQTVVHITQPGTYVLRGTLSAGQILVDLGEDAKTDPDAVVTLVLDGADITCDVAPAILFYSVYECDTAWVSYDEGDEDAAEYKASAEQDTSKAGANLVIADGSENTVTGSHVAKIYKDSAEQKKKYKFDGAVYSKMSMNVNGGAAGDGVLTITADNEGLDTELHLTINGGVININSQDDGINTNEDGVSVTTINGGSLHIVAGLGSEGDGIDSNGYLVINGGVVISTANPKSDAGLDSDLGSYVNGGYVVATGSTMDWAESDSEQVTMNLQFASMQGADEAIVVTDTDGKVIFAYDPDKDEATGSNNRSYQGAVISCPDFEVGETYHVYVGGSVNGTEVNGLYDAATVTGFSGATQQEYTGTDVGGRMGGPGMGGPNGQRGQAPDGSATADGQDGVNAAAGQTGEPPARPEGDSSQAADGERPARPDGMNAENGQQGERPELPDGVDPENGPQGERPELPDGVDPENGPQGERPELPDGVNPENGQMGPGGAADATGTASTEFYMTDKVNAFSGVTDVGTNTETKTGNGETTQTALPFTDVKNTDWFQENVAYVYEKGLFKGMTETTFAPQTSMSRAMLWCVLARMEDADTADGETWYSAAQQWAMKEKVSDGTNPDTDITREQIVTMLWRLAGEPSSSQSVSRFSDSGSVDSWAETAVRWAVEKGILQGDEQTRLNPTKAATRAEVAALIQRYCELAK